MTKQAEEVPYRDYKCATYRICLKNAARFDLMLDCTDCPKRRHRIPKPSEIYLEILAADTLCCTRLLQAIFYPEKYYHHHDVRKTIESVADAPLA